MIKTYIIEGSYSERYNDGEVDIKSDGLIYTEVAVNDGYMSGVQTLSTNDEVNNKIAKNCKQIADLIREIDELNKES